MRVNLRSIAQAANSDSKQALIDSAGPLTDYEVFHNLVLVATYIRPTRKIKTNEGKLVELHLSDKALEEDRFQGKMGLVLKCGPMAFKDDAHVRFGGVKIEPHDWVLFRPSDGIELFIKDHMGLKNDGLSCRLIEDTLIKGRVTDPALIY